MRTTTDLGHIEISVSDSDGDPTPIGVRIGGYDVWHYFTVEGIAAIRQALGDAITEIDQQGTINPEKEHRQ